MKTKHNLYFIIFSIVAVLFIQHKVKAQNPTFMFKSNLSSDTILIGDRVELSIYASIPTNYKVEFPVFADTVITGIETLGTPIIDTISKKDSNLELIYKLLVTSFDSGYFRIPGFKLPISNNSSADTAYTSPLWLTVNTLPADTAQASIYDIKPPISQPITFAEVAPWIGGFLLLAAIVWLLIVYLKRRKKNEPLFFPRKPAELPHVIALRELEKIRVGKMWETNNHKLFHSVLTDIIRNYIEGRFDLPAMEQTTFEIIENFKKHDIAEKKLLDELEETLSFADLVKFAKMIPTTNENKSSLDFGFKFVNETKQVDENKKPDESEKEDISIDAENRTTNTIEQ